MLVLVGTLVSVDVGVRHAAVHVDVLVYQIDPQEQVAVGEHVGDRTGRGDRVVLAQDHGSVGDLLQDVELVRGDDDRLAYGVEALEQLEQPRSVRGSSPLVGSSSISTSGLIARTEASATFFFSPPLRL